VALVTVADGVCMRVGGGWITVAAVVMLWVDGCVGCWRFFGLPFRVSRTRTTHLQLPINHHARATPPLLVLVVFLVVFLRLPSFAAAIL
jgi:hypothetical protein